LTPDGDGAAVHNSWLIIGLMTLPLLASQAQAEDKKESDSIAELEIGAAGEWGLPNGEFGVGPSAAIEFTAVRDRLEIELGISPLFDRGETEWGTELIFKTPVASYDSMEVTFGLGPAWQYKIGDGEITNSLAGEAQFDFQFWQLPERKLGWFVEPSYGYSFAGNHEQSLGVTVGLLIAIP
jgi:hypothetical protein